MAAIEAGADDFIAKPFDQAELLARVRSLLRIKQYHDTIEAQAAELGGVEPAARAAGRASRSTQLERVGRLRRFLSPQLAELIVSSGDESFLESHRREITVVFCDLRGFTRVRGDGRAGGRDGRAAASTTRRWASWSTAFEGTLERFTGDGLMVFFNDPLPCPDAPERAVRMAVAMRERVTQLAEDWQQHGPRPATSASGIAQGHATLGRDRLRGPLRLRGDRHRHEPRGAAVRRGGRRADPDQPARPARGGGDRGRPIRSGS